ncbi:class I SAM-dependent methyltransferase [Achromobacter sp. NPDC058515]|uniref:class I SAM-dependent methyltransferase n=1 Tax=Achromobacter sp. NPDC058515 TaxID=3346533 RepID=UPI0036465E68
MERLSFGQSSRYDGLEAAIHIARYSFAKELCAGKRVLDAACGEGYGSRLLANWGASEVVGVDISAEAIASAQQHFSSENVKFIQNDAETLPRHFEPHSFDLIVSFETIEHVQDPELFLRNIRDLLKPGGVVAISCPNDWWYFPTEAERNPFHLRKYRLDEFRALAESVLGQASAWFVGGPIAGFANLQLNEYLTDDNRSGQVQMLQTSETLHAQFVPAELDAGPGPDNASYFLGIWGMPAYGSRPNAGTAILPLSMDCFKKGIFQGHLPRDEAPQQAPDPAASAIGVFDAISSGDVDRLARDAALRAQAANTELSLVQGVIGERDAQLRAKDDEIAQLRAQMRTLNEQVDELSVPAARYLRLRDKIPHWVRAVALKFFKGAGDR